jgi:Zinc finger C-x8-C-x5-C-x3-H type (and similar)
MDFAGAPSAVTSVVPGATAANGPCKPSVYKSRLCVFHAAGRCSHGSECSFAHSAYELSDPKTVICPKLEQIGFCDDQTNCPFAHEQGDLKQLPKVVKTALCRYYPIGKCRAGNACRHAHSLDELDPALLPLLVNSSAGLSGYYTPTDFSYTPSPLESPTAASSDVDLRSLQASLLNLALELEKLRLNKAAGNSNDE